MTFAFLKGWLDKMFWPLVIIYLGYLLFKVYTYFAGKSHAVNQDIYQQFYTKSWLTLGLLLVLALLFKYWGKVRIATLILAVPAGITLGVIIASILVWVFLAAVFIIFGK